MAKKFTVKVVFGEVAVAAFQENPRITYEKLREHGDVSKVSFDTEAERDAYIRGLEDSVGWQEVDYVKM